MKALYPLNHNKREIRFIITIILLCSAAYFQGLQAGRFEANNEHIDFMEKLNKKLGKAVDKQNKFYSINPATGEEKEIPYYCLVGDQDRILPECDPFNLRPEKHVPTVSFIIKTEGTIEKGEIDAPKYRRFIIDDTKPVEE